MGQIGIADPDKIEISNLNRQTLFTTNDIGKYKVDQAKYSIKRINNKIKIKVLKKKITLKNIKSAIRDFDIICDGTDNFETRYLVNDECKKMKKYSSLQQLVNLMVIYINLILKKKLPVTDALCRKCLLLKEIVKQMGFSLL